MELAYQIQLYKSRIVQCPYCGCVINATWKRQGVQEYLSFTCLDYGHSFSESWLKFYQCGFYKALKRINLKPSMTIKKKRALVQFQPRRKNKER